MYYRAKVYFGQDVLTAIPMTTCGFHDQGTAQIVLDALMATGQYTGGGIECEVPGIGWVIDDEVETAIIIKNRNESDREYRDEAD